MRRLVDDVPFGVALARQPPVVEQFELARANDAKPVLADEGCAGAVEGELIGQAAHPPAHRAARHVDLRDLAEAAEGDQEGSIGVEVERVAVGPVHGRARAARGIQVGDREVIEGGPGEERLPLASTCCTAVPVTTAAGIPP